MIGGNNWEAVEEFLGYPSDKPKTVDEWVEVAGEVKAKIGDAELAA